MAQQVPWRTVFLPPWSNSPLTGRCTSPGSFSSAGTPTLAGAQQALPHFPGQPPLPSRLLTRVVSCMRRQGRDGWALAWIEMPALKKDPVTVKNLVSGLAAWGVGDGPPYAFVRSTKCPCQIQRQLQHSAGSISLTKKDKQQETLLAE